MRTKLLHISVLWIAAFCSAVSHAQHKQAFDSILKNGTLQIYEHPDEAIKIGKYVANAAPDLKTKINGLMLVTDAYSSKRDYQKSLEYVIKAKNLSEKSDNMIIRIKILTKIAIQYQQLKIYDKSIQYLDKSGALAKSYPQKDSIRMYLGNNFIIRGFIYKEQLNCDIAIGYLKQGIAEYRQAKSPLVNANLSIVSYNLGNCYIRLDDNEAAKKAFAESIVYAKKIKANSLLAFAQKGLAEVYTLEGRYQEAIAVLSEAATISKNVGDLVLNRGIYKGLSENYLAMNDWEKYREFHQKHLDAILMIKESERKSVSDSLNESARNEDLKLAKTKQQYLSAAFLFLVLSILGAINIYFMQKSASKKFVKLQQHMQKNPQKSSEI